MGTPGGYELTILMVVVVLGVVWFAMKLGRTMNNRDEQNGDETDARSPQENAGKLLRFRVIGGILIHPVLAAIFALNGFLFGETMIKVGSRSPEPGFDGAVTALATLGLLHFFTLGGLFVVSLILGMVIGHLVGWWQTGRGV